MTATADDLRFMKVALDVCRRGVEAGQTPFGACIVHQGEVITTAHNVVWREHDPTAHAEVAAIRQACRDLKVVKLPGCTIYSTTEPCPMCFSAIHWAGISRIVYGAGIADAQAFGFSELPISNQQMNELGRAGVQILAGVMREEALELFREWQRRGGKTY